MKPDLAERTLAHREWASGSLARGLLLAGLLGVASPASDMANTSTPAGSPGERLVLAPDELARRDGSLGWQFMKKSAAGRNAVDESPVYYLDGRPRSGATRRIITGKLVAELHPGVEAGDIAREHGLIDLGSPQYAPELRIFRAHPPSVVIERLGHLRADPRIRSVEPLWARLRIPREKPDDPLYPQQWYLKNVGQNGGSPGIDVNVERLWGTFGNAGTRGQGIRVGVVDDGIEYTHPDFAGRLDLLNDRNWNDGPADSGEARSPENRHGTAVAGLLGAGANNNRGICGVAPDVTLVSLRLIAGPVDDQEEAEAFTHLINGPSLISIKNNSWGPPDEQLLLTGPGPLARSALANATTNGRNGRGTIFVFAVGNGGQSFENSNSDGYANGVHVIAVGAVNDDGRHAGYSEAGANVCVCAPSDGGLGHQRMITTDRSGASGYNPSTIDPASDLEDLAYTRGFGGTSAAAAIVSGTCALILQTNSALGWRDVKEILMRSAKKVDPDSSGWQVNDGGLPFHHNYGAGLVDAGRACTLAAQWTNLPPMREFQVPNNLTSPIPDNTPQGLTRTFQVNVRRRVEHAAVRLRLNHPVRADLRVTLTSPAGTTSTLAVPHFDPFAQANYPDWTFSSVQMWGEPSPGAWTLRVTDEAAQDAGTFQSAVLMLTGSDLPPPPVVTSASEIRAVRGEPFSHRITGTNGPLTVETAGPLPPELKLDPQTGILAGIPTERGLFSITFHVSNATGNSSHPVVLRVITPFEKWISEQDLMAAAGPGDDPDADSIPNLVEYARGTDPRVPDTPAITQLIRRSDGGFTFSFRRIPARHDLDCLVEVSTDLKSWALIAHGTGGEGLVSAGPRYEISELAAVTGFIDVRIVDSELSTPQSWFRVRYALEP